MKLTKRQRGTRAALNTTWAQGHGGWWRWADGVMLRVVHRTDTAEVDGRHLSSGAPVMWCSGLDLADARAWCERWGAIVARECGVTGGAVVSAPTMPWRPPPTTAREHEEIVPCDVPGCDTTDRADELHCHGCGARICDHHAAAWGHHRAEAHLAEDDES